MSGRNKENVWTDNVRKVDLKILIKKDFNLFDWFRSECWFPADIYILNTRCCCCCSIPGEDI